MIIHAIFVMCSRICKQEQKKKTQKSFSSSQSKLLSVDKEVLLSCYLNCNWKMTKSWHVEKKNNSLWINSACFVDFKILSMPNLTKASFFDFCKEFFVLEKKIIKKFNFSPLQKRENITIVAKVSTKEIVCP